MLAGRCDHLTSITGWLRVGIFVRLIQLKELPRMSCGCQTRTILTLFYWHNQLTWDKEVFSVFVRLIQSKSCQGCPEIGRSLVNIRLFMHYTSPVAARLGLKKINPQLSNSHLSSNPVISSLDRQGQCCRKLGSWENKVQEKLA